jgi:DNA-binding transcriptional regulator YdaS (Cro superfamily)
MHTPPTSFDALKRAVAAYGGQSAMARALGVSQGAVWRWLNVTRELPAEYVLRVEAATCIPRHELRLDIYPLDLPAAHAPWLGIDRRRNGVASENLHFLSRPNTVGAA